MSSIKLVFWKFFFSPNNVSTGVFLVHFLFEVILFFKIFWEMEIILGHRINYQFVFMACLCHLSHSFFIIFWWDFRIWWYICPIKTRSSHVKPNKFLHLWRQLVRSFESIQKKHKKNCPSMDLVEMVGKSASHSRHICSSLSIKNTYK